MRRESTAARVVKNGHVCFKSLKNLSIYRQHTKIQMLFLAIAPPLEHILAGRPSTRADSFLLRPLPRVRVFPL
ncbi:hypothetical protein DPEC_G00211390 [Dallia pectoralis]|uniref:Uncharacterized protein n=1 Tax=Dallia pectoralis TaxID=75939 RepID=A0ACC2G653_DALPE|nr:hypothetical protein DPEC_G00211390 [Dallia pectoralis]